ncbi:MAG: tetratricopeptide repeat protein, partial [Myxococcota bacterium]
FRGGAPRGVAQVLQRGMSDEPAARFESVSALRAALLTGRRRRRLVLATVGVAAAIGTTALAVRPQAVIPCKARTDLIDAGWGAERRAAVEATLVQSGLGYAPATWDRIGWQLDEAATQWADDDLAACRASRNADPDQRRRAEGELLCLERAAATLGHATTVLAEGDPQVLARAVTLVDATRDRMVCDRPAPEARDVSALLSELDRAGVADAAGRSASATAGWQAVLDATQPGELPRLRASALLGLANTAAPYGDSAELRWATEALTEAERSADPTTQAQAWIHLAGLAGRAGSAQTLAFRVARAQRLMEDGSIPPRLTAELLWRVGEAYQSAGMFAESAAVLKESRRAFEEHVPGAASRTYVISSQAQAELFVGRGDQALSLATEALAAFERSRGMAHPEAAVLLIRRAAVHGALQDNGGAAADLRAAIVLLQANPSYRPDLSITAHDQLAEALLNDGAHEEALRQSDRALALAADLYEDDDASRATYLWTRAAILYETEAYGRALRTIDDALEALGDGDPDKETSVLALLLLRAETLLRLERRDEGRLALRVATDAARAAVDRRSPAGLQHTEVIARSLLALGEVEAGRKEIALGIEDALALGDDGRVRTLQALLTDSGPSGER